MTQAPSRYENDIRPLRRPFLIAAGLFLASATIFASQLRTLHSEQRAYQDHLRAQSGLARVREAIANRRLVLAHPGVAQPREVSGSSPDRLIYARIDDMKARLRPDDITITALEKKGGELSIQYTLTFLNPRYCELLNGVGYLQRCDYLYTPVSSLAVSQAAVKGRGGVSFIVKGTVLSPERNSP
jgi:hypothetical protein